MRVSLPYKILIDDHITEQVDEFLRSAGLGKQCALFCDPAIYQLFGKTVTDALPSFSVTVIDTGSTEKNNVQALAARCADADFIIGMGGGRTTDIAKYAATLSGKEWVALPTILSHDGVVSSRAVLSENGSKISVEAKEPFAIIADLATIRNAPYRYLAAGAGDLISNFAATEDWKIADKAGKEQYHAVMAKLSLLAAETVAEHIPEIRSRTRHGVEMLLWSLICSGFAMNIYGSSRPCSGSEHNFSHALEEAGSKALHCEQVALGTVISTYLQHGDWERIRSLLTELQLPTTAAGLGISADNAVGALVAARTIRERYTILNEYTINREKAKDILSRCGII